MEVSEYLVGSPAFKAGGTGDPRTAGSIPVHLRHFAQGFVALAVIAAVLVSLASTRVGASARLLSSVPEDGASLQELDTVSFEFDTLLLDAGALITVTKLDGTAIEVGPAVVEGSTLRAEVIERPVRGNYEATYDVQSSDGARNRGSIRIAIDEPGQEFSGGLIAVLAILGALVFVVFLAARADRRRPRRK